MRRSAKKMYSALVFLEMPLSLQDVAGGSVPFLSLPADTSKDVALQVFIGMNTK